MSATRTSSRITRLALVVGSVGALVGAGTLAAAADSTPSTRHAQVLHFGIKFSPQNVIDVPPLQRSDGDFRAGDYAVFSDTLVDAHGRTVGTEGGSGLITGVSNTAAQIDFVLTISIPGGQIAVQGLSSTDPHKHLGIVGGTGRFVGARGEVDAIENGDDTGSLTITLR